MPAAPPVVPPASPSPHMLGPCHVHVLATEPCLWLFDFLQATVALWKIFNLAWRSPVVLEYFPNLFLRLLFQVYISTQEMPEEAETFWKRCQEQHGLSAKPNRCSMPVLPVSPSLPCPQGRSRGSQRHLAFALHTGLPCRP